VCLTAGLLVQAHHVARGIVESCGDLGRVRADRLHQCASVGDDRVDGRGGIST